MKFRCVGYDGCLQGSDPLCMLDLLFWCRSGLQGFFVTAFALPVPRNGVPTLDRTLLRPSGRLIQQPLRANMARVGDFR